MLSLVALLAAASLVAADGTTDPSTTPATDAEIASARTTLPACKSFNEACGRGVRQRPADCEAQGKACKDAVDAFIKARLQANADAFKARLDMIRQNFNLPAITNIDDAKAKCKTFVTNNVDAGDEQTKLLDDCDKITDIQSGLRAAAAAVQSVARKRFDKLAETNPEGAAALKAAADKLRDSIATQRAFLGDARAKIADALDARVAAIQQARADRQDAIEKAKAALADYKKKLADAKTDEERAQIKADGKAQLEAAVKAAKAAQEARRAEIKGDRKALIQKALDFRAQRKANRKAIVVDFKALVGEIADLRKAAKDEDEGAQVEPAPAAPMTRKRAGGAVVVVTCEIADTNCNAGVNNLAAKFAATDADVTITETTDAELNEAPVEDVPADAATPTTKPGGKDKASASSVMLGLAAVVLAVASMF